MAGLQSFCSYCPDHANEELRTSFWCCVTLRLGPLALPDRTEPMPISGHFDAYRRCIKKDTTPCKHHLQLDFALVYFLFSPG